MDTPNDWSRSSRRVGIQLAYPLEESRLAKWKPPFIVQPKYDGERCRAICTHGSVALYSSEANLILSVPHINEALLPLANMDLELDGELYTHGLPLNQIHSIISRKNELHPQFADINYHVFDLVDTEMSQAARLARIMRIMEGVPKDPVFMAPHTICETFSEVMSALDWSMERGYEGIIVRHIEAYYLRRRSVWMMKFKPRREDIYQIVAVKEEVSQYGEPKGSLGALICHAHDEEKTFNVGTGFTPEQRRELWLQRETLPGRLVRVKYQHLTSARGVPRSAVFLEIL